MVNIHKSFMNNSKNNNLFLAFFWPFAGLVSCLRNWRQPWAMNIFWLVCTFMAFIQIYCPAGEVLGTGSDIGRYVLRLQMMHENGGTLASAIAANGKPDLYQPILTYLVSKITGEGHILYLIFGAIYGFFYSRNIWFVLRRMPEAVPNLFLVMVALLFLICPIWNVSGVRMWTALQVLAYGALPYLFDKDKSKLLWVVLTPWIHFSFMMPVVFFFAYLLLPEKIKSSFTLLNVSLALFVFTFFVNILDISAFGSMLERIIAPDLYEENIAGYLGDQYMERIISEQDAKSLLFKVSMFVEKYTIFVLSIIAVLLYKRKRKADAIVPMRLFCFALLFYAIANILSIVPSGGRYVILAQMFLVPCILLSTAHNRHAYLGIINICFLSCILLVIYKIRIGCECYGYNLFCGNFLWGTLIENNISIINFLQNI